MQAAKETVGLGVLTGVGYGTMGAFGALGVPGSAITPIGSALTLVNVGRMAKTGLTVADTVVKGSKSYKVAKENKKQPSHVGRKYSSERPKALLGITTKQLVDFIVQRAMDGREINYRHIRSGYDNCFAAMEASVKGSDGYAYCAQTGFTS